MAEFALSMVAIVLFMVGGIYEAERLLGIPVPSAHYVFLKLNIDSSKH